MSGKGLGINKDLEPLVRAVRRAGGSVEVTASTHVRWTMPDGTTIHSGLTISGATARVKQRELERALAEFTLATTSDAVSARPYRIDTHARGKYVIVDARTGEPLCNGNGYIRTFGTRAAALSAVTALARA